MKGWLLLVILLSGAALAGLMVGEVLIGPSALWVGFWSNEGPGALTIRVLRGPRIATALGAGCLLGLAGALLQNLLRNPLAAPDVLGFNSGTGLAVILSVSLGFSLPMPLVSAIGGLLAALAMVMLAYRPGHATSTLTLILVGLGVGFTTGAFGSFLLLTMPATEAAEAQRWLTGSLAARDWGHVMQVWLMGACLVVFLVAQIPSLKLLELGSDLAAGLGLHVEGARWALLGTAVLLAATAVAVVGPVPFVALMAPPLGIALTGARYPFARLVAAGCAGALICVASDLAARVAIPGLQLPIGVMTGILGAPYLLWRLSREMEKGEL